MNLKLFLTFFKIGLFTFGGGYAMIPHINDSVVTRYNWISEDELLDIVAIAESTPGPIAINIATFIGYKQNKFLGALCATLGIVLPSLFIIFIISLFFNKFMSYTYVKYAFEGIKCCVAFLILKAGIKLFIKSKKCTFSLIITALVLMTSLTLNILSISFSSIYLILLGGLLGIILNSPRKKVNE